MGSSLLIVLDTHEWIWLADRNTRSSQHAREQMETHRSTGLMVSAISLIEVANAARKGRLFINKPLTDWFEDALSLPGVELYPLDAAVASASVDLPGEFHKDPADRIIVATARVLDVPLLTSDDLIRRYPHVRLA
ncbi:type II toxin-antitoxin system VapC family toxin [bacterium]|nr:MAG: type II toxin-antitoxin system VapC family toxin [bacterium]